MYKLTNVTKHFQSISRADGTLNLELESLASHEAS